MASQGPLSGGTFADDATVGTSVWASPGNAAASDDSRATTGAAIDTTHYLRATNFGFTIPAGATIDGIVVGVERSLSAGSSGNDSTVKLYSGGAFIGNNKATATAWSTTDTYEDHGGASDMWGTSLTAADINNSGFGVGISAVSTGITSKRIDHIRITVYYTESGFTGWGIPV